jgi:hypothetical protein
MVPNKVSWCQAMLSFTMICKVLVTNIMVMVIERKFVMYITIFVHNKSASLTVLSGNLKFLLVII